MDLLNKPFVELSPFFTLNMQSTSNLFQLIAHSFQEGFIYLDFLLTCNPHILPFVLPDTLAKSATLISPKPEANAVIQPISFFVMNPTFFLPTIMKHPALLDTLTAHTIFSEVSPYKNSSHEELKLEMAASLAIECLSHNEESAAFFLKKYTPQMKAHISNPFIFFALLNKQAGRHWLKQNIYLLKEIPAICYEFLDLGELFISNSELFNAFSKEINLVNAFPKKYRDQIIQQKNTSQEKNKENNKESSLINKIKGHGYKLNDDFSLTRTQNHYTLLFASIGDTLAHLRKAFKKPIKKVKVDCPASKKNIYQLSLSFPEDKLDSIINIITTNKDLAKHAAYKGAISGMMTEQTQPHAEKSSGTINIANWQQFIAHIFVTQIASTFKAKPKQIKYPSVLLIHKAGKGGRCKEIPNIIRNYY